MKRTLLFVFVAATVFSNQTEAQIPGVKKVTSIIPKVMFGVKVGANFNEMSSSTVWSQSYKGGFVGGVFLGLHGKKLGVQGEALIHTAKFAYNISSSNYISTVNLDVPVLVEYKIIPRLWAQLGPQFTSVLSKTDHSTGISNSLATTDFSGVMGLQGILPLHLVVGARYILGLVDQNSKSIQGVTGTWKNRSFQISLGFRFM